MTNPAGYVNQRDLQEMLIGGFESILIRREPKGGLTFPLYVHAHHAMSDAQFRALLDLLMCSDPWPVSGTKAGNGHDAMIAFADTESKRRGYTSWIDAYHRLPATVEDPA